MKGDIIKINENHIKAAKQVIELILPEIENTDGKYIITIAGESGSGKSEIAASISNLLKEKNIKSFIFQQDDYFVYPPKTNANMRKRDINHVGMTEVKLSLLDAHMKEILKGKYKIEKPLVFFQEDKIDKEVVNLEDRRVIIVEGTYTTILKNVHKHIFIDRDYHDTLESRKERSREKQDEFLEKILTIEHEIISPQKKFADIIITKNFNAIKN